ncbi:MAG: hypothetical protein O3B83_02755 [Bacteroidetes bacterium]|nr:hypothetical protein [Bacteroidota bacterium]
MSNILDEHLTQEKQKERCKRMRAYTLLFAGMMACTALVIRFMEGFGERYAIIAGMMSITFQSHYCFFKKKKKTWLGLTRVILITMITGLALAYYMIPELLRF